ncbi:MAG: 6-phosphogluconolactonase [Nitrospirae bacterium]|nr:6-phosphogluconolactonase [Nitrospirota bacterium]
MAAAADEILRRATDGVASQGKFTIALSGGTTPRALYALLASTERHERSWRAGLPWDRIHFFWGDERHVPPEHPDSNFRVAQDAMLSKAPVPAENVHRILAESSSAELAAEAYAEHLRTFFRLEAGQWPRFDLILLGMGADGHTASLFPESEALYDQTRIVAAPWVEKLKTHRVTLTPPAINNAAAVVFLVQGEEKAHRVKEILEGELAKPLYPAQLIRPSRGALIWILDRGAAKLLRSYA